MESLLRRVSRVMRPRALAVVLLCVVASFARAQTIVNAGFEDGPAVTPVEPIVPIAPGSLALSGWTVVGGSVNVIDQGYWAPKFGSRSLMLSGATGPGGIEQAIATTVGQRYQLAFWLSGDPLSPPVLKHLRASAADVQQTFEFDSSPAWHWDMAWSARTLEFTATATTTTIRFTSLDPEPWGPAIDSVTVTPLGEPPAPVASLALGPVRPDPVVADAAITFTMPSPGRVRLSVHDLRGRLVSRVVEADHDAGEHTIPLPMSALGSSPGVLFVVLETPAGRRIRRCTLLR
ncbi:MAG: hypothetical protein RL760_345 [Candidatus Eisenbacteria bacterium]|jgi:choice-of-anchor C domain-containing protein